MRLIVILMMAALILFSSFELSYAKRFGGGRSFGVQRSIRTPIANKLNPVNKLREQGNRWLAPMMGLIAGGILGSLLMSHGFGTGILSWLLILGGIFLLVSLFRRNQTSSLRYQTAPNAQPVHDSFNQALSRLDPANHDSGSGYQDDFLRDAKVLFLRLQAAYDQKNMQDLKIYTTPEVFAEIQMQLQERGDELNQTNVSALCAELLDEASEYHENQEVKIASVKFSGFVQESPSLQPSSFQEIWHFQRQANTAQWQVAGIEQK